MACFRPMVAHRDRLSGSVSLGYGGAATGDRLSLPCSRCIGCRLDRAQAWSVRITHEASLYDSNLFVTLDYRPDALPASGSLEYGDFQRFMKRLRKVVSGVSEAPNGLRPVRFFVAGEYGERFRRPHWHAILFNVRLADQELYANGTYRSELLEETWKHGRAVIGGVTPASASYVAGYTMKKVYGQAAKRAYTLVDHATGEVMQERRPEFCAMSRRPGIGAWWYDRFHADMFPADVAVQDGQVKKTPRYYRNRLYGDDPLTHEEVAYARYLKALERPVEEGSPERLAVREQVALARQEFYSPRRATM